MLFASNFTLRNVHGAAYYYLLFCRYLYSSRAQVHSYMGVQSNYLQCSAVQCFKLKVFGHKLVRKWTKSFSHLFIWYSSSRFVSFVVSTQLTLFVLASIHFYIQLFKVGLKTDLKIVFFVNRIVLSSKFYPKVFPSCNTIC